MIEVTRAEKLKFLNGLLTVQDVCRMFDVSGQTIHNWKRDNGFPAYEIRGFCRQTLRFDLEEVESWAAASGKRIVEKPTQLRGVDRRHTKEKGRAITTKRSNPAASGKKPRRAA